MNNIISAIDGPDGFSTELYLNNRDLELVRNLIRTQWLQRIEEFDPGKLDKFMTLEMSNYHQFSDILDHKNMWSKSKRILNSNAVNLFRQTSLIKDLEFHFGTFLISAEDGIEKEEIYWRLVRPNYQSDVGPLHADEWFWSLGHGTTPSGYRRIKVWISIFSELGKNGFGFVRGSHKKDWKYHGVIKDGMVKPQIDEDLDSLKLEIFEATPGQAIVFHDKLLHGGVVGGSSTRVSLEFTVFVKDAKYK
jgi:hypothetical protein